VAQLIIQIDLMMISWAIHRLNGISSPANAAYSPSELAFQLKTSRAKCIFTCSSLLPTALEAVKLAGIPKHAIYLCPVSDPSPKAAQLSSGMKSLEDLIWRGKGLLDLEDQIWSAEQGKTQTAFICYSSGTSGLPVYSIRRLVSFHADDE
jgi:acyl-CoA synthetase (AMP-forming)/AMP-acid ligase II